MITHDLSFHSFFAHHLTTFRNGLSNLSPLNVLFLSLSSLRFALASFRNVLAAAASSPPVLVEYNAEVEGLNDRWESWGDGLES